MNETDFLDSQAIDFIAKIFRPETYPLPDRSIAECARGPGPANVIHMDRKSHKSIGVMAPWREVLAEPIVDTGPLPTGGCNGEEFESSYVAASGKRQRMRWSPRGAHRVALVRAAVLDGRLPKAA